MGECEPIIIDDGSCELLSTIDIPELPFGRFSPVSATQQTWDGADPRDMSCPDFEIVHG